MFTICWNLLDSMTVGLLSVFFELLLSLECKILCGDYFWLFRLLPFVDFLRSLKSVLSEWYRHGCLFLACIHRPIEWSFKVTWDEILFHRYGDLVLVFTAILDPVVVCYSSFGSVLFWFTLLSHFLNPFSWFQVDFQEFLVDSMVIFVQIWFNF